MANLRELRRRISGVKNTSKITQAMKMVSAAKLRRAQNAIESARPYVLKLQEILSNVIEGLGDSYSHKLMEKREVKNAAIVVIGSDKGLCGSFNAQIFKAVEEFINGELKEKHPDVTPSIIAVGNKTVSHYNKTDKNILDTFRDVFNNLEFSRTKDIINVFQDKFLNDEVDVVYVFYNEFINVVRQQVVKEQLLPIEPKKELMEEKEEDEKEDKYTVNYIFEPNQKEIMDVLIPKLLNISLWRNILESNAAEQAARMIAMDNATTNANELVDKLNLEYNKRRQEAITTEMLEIVSGADALKK